MNIKLFFTVVLLSSFQLFFAQDIKSETIKLATKTTITTVTTIKDTIKVAPEVAVKLTTNAEKEALKKEAKTLNDKIKEEKKALREAKKIEKEQKDFEKKNFLDAVSFIKPK